MRTDKELLDALDEMLGVGLIHDDNKFWYVSDGGFQNVVTGEEPQPLQSTFTIIGDELKRGRTTVREAINAYLDEDENQGSTQGREL